MIFKFSILNVEIYITLFSVSRLDVEYPLNNNNNSSFLYAIFPWGSKRLQRIITPVIGYISMPHLYSA